MINLLPPQEKEKIRKYYRDRLLIVSFLLFSLAILMGVIFLLPSFFLATFKEKAVLNQVDIIKKAVSFSEQRNVEEAVRAVNEKLLILRKEGEGEVRLSQLLTTVIENKDDNLLINGFFSEKQKEDGGQKNRITVRGISPDRETLLDFVDTLREEKAVTSVDLPIGSLVKSRNIPFSLIVITSVVAGQKE